MLSSLEVHRVCHRRTAALAPRWSAQRAHGQAMHRALLVCCVERHRRRMRVLGPSSSHEARTAQGVVKRGRRIACRSTQAAAQLQSAGPTNPLRRSREPCRRNAENLEGAPPPEPQYCCAVISTRFLLQQRRSAVVFRLQRLHRLIAMPGHSGALKRRDGRLTTDLLFVFPRQAGLLLASLDSPTRLEATNPRRHVRRLPAPSSLLLLTSLPVPRRIARCDESVTAMWP